MSVCVSAGIRPGEKTRRSHHL